MLAVQPISKEAKEKAQKIKKKYRDGRQKLSARDATSRLKAKIVEAINREIMDFYFDTELIVQDIKLKFTEVEGFYGHNHNLIDDIEVTVDVA